MYKKAKRIIAVLLAAAMIWQPSWSGSWVNAEEAQTDAVQDEGQMIDNAQPEDGGLAEDIITTDEQQPEDANQVQDAQSEGEQAVQEEQKKELEKRIVKEEAKKEAEEHEKAKARLEEEQKQLEMEDQAEVSAEDAEAISAPEDMQFVRIKDIGLDCDDKENVSAGDNFNLVVTLQNNMDQAVTISGTAYWENSVTNSSEENLKLDPNKEGELKLPISISKYSTKKEVSLLDFDYFVYDSSGNQIAFSYYYPNDSYTWYDDNNTYDIPDSMGYTYNGEADYSITYAPNPDVDAPHVTGVRVSPQEASTYEDITVEIDYSDDLTGIKEITVDFLSSTEEYESFCLNGEDLAEGEYKEGTLRITSKAVRELESVYQLERINIEDYAGNSRWYYLSDDGKMRADDSEEAFSSVDYRIVTKGTLPFVMITDMKLDCEDKDHVSAGDSFNLVVTLQNNMDQTVSVSGSAFWNNSDAIDSIRDLNLNPGATGELKLPISISKYSTKKEVSLYDFDYFVYDLTGTQIASGYYYPDSSYSWNENSNTYYLPDSVGYAYTGQADYSITNAPNPDTGAPVITSVKVNGSTSADVATMDNVEITVDYSEDSSGISYIYMTFVNEYEDMIYFTLNEEQTAEGQYTGKSTLTLSDGSAKTFESTYKLDYIWVLDYAGNGAAYNAYDGIIKVSSGSEDGFTQPSFTVTEKSPLNYLLIKDMEIVGDTGEEIDKENITAGDPVNLKVTFQNDSSETVRISSMFAEWNSENESYSQWEYPDAAMAPGETAVIMIPAPNNKYGGERTWTLGRIYYNFNIDSGGQSGSSGYGSFDHYDDGDSYGYTIANNYFTLPVEDIIVYTGQGDYTIAHAPYQDEEAPVINSVTLMGTDSATAEIETIEDVEVQVNYTEVGAGIQEMSLYFSSDSGKTETYSISADEVEYYQGTDQTITLSKNAYRELNEEYRLNSIYVKDFVGNSRSYSLVNGKLIPDDGTEEEGFTQASYKVVAETDEKLAFINELHLERADGETFDPDNVSAGDELILVLGLENNFKEDILISIGSGEWKDSNWGYYTLLDSTDFFEVTNENGTSEARIPFEVPRFSAVNCSYYFDSLNYSISSADGSNLLYGRMDGDSQYYYGYGDGFDSLNLPVPEGNADFFVTVSETPDTEPPHVTSIQAEADQVEAPGTVKFEIYAETGPAKICSVTSFELADTADPGSGVNLSVADLYYSPSKRCYILEAELPDNMFTGEYYIEYLDVQDEAGRSTTYHSDGETHDKLADWDGNRLDNVFIKVINEDKVSYDYDAPVVTGITMTPNEIQAPGQITYTLTASDASGISSLYLFYRSESGCSMSINIPMVQSGDKWQGTYDVGAYLEPGEYQLREMSVRDSSGRNNYTYISRSANGELLSQCDLTVLADADTIYISSTEEEMQEQLASVKAGATVVMSARGNDLVLIPASGMQIIKSKGLDVIIVSGDGKQEVHFSGDDLTDEMVQQTLYLGAYASGFYEENQIEFANGYDRACQWFYIEPYVGTKIPFTVWFRPDDRIIAKAEETGNARLSQYDTSYFEIIEENIKFSDGYYVMEFPDGCSGYEAYAISTDTVKFFDYPLTVTATPSFSSDTVAKGSSFDVQLSVTNKNDVVLEDVALFVLNDEELCEWYTFESDDPNVQIGEGENAYAALVSQFKSGETVKLTAKFTIPEDAEGERIPLYFVASSVTDNDELISYGDYEMRITLQDASTVLLGDMTGDGKIGLDDLSFMLRVVNERIDITELTNEQLEAGDVSRKEGEAIGKITLEDLSKLLRFLNERITSLE